MRVLHLVAYKFDTSRRHWLTDFYPAIEVSVLDFEMASTPVYWLLALTKQTLKALAIYRRYDLVLGNGMATILPLAFVQSFLHRSRPKIVGIDISANRVGRGLTMIFRIAVRPISAIICYTRAQRDWWAREVGYRKAQFVPIGDSNFDGVRGTEGDYIFSGGYIARDYPTLVRAAADLGERVILVVGPDPVTGRTGLEQTTLPKNVKVYTRTSLKRFLELMSRSRMVVLAMQDKPYAAGQMVLLQAMSMGKPIIVTRTAGTIDYVEDGKTALLVEPNNVVQVKEKILLISRDAELRKNLGRNARTKWEKEFTFDAMLQKTSAVIASVL
jgi:glycosyltransferase involved in cell wall biosynthesis